MSIDTTDLTPTQTTAALADEAEWTGPSDEDWAWFAEATYVDPAEREW